MNPYKTLSKLHRINSLPASLTKSTGSIFRFLVEPVDENSESQGVDLPASVRVRAWACEASDLTPVGGDFAPPEGGDVLTVEGRDGRERSYAVARDSVSSRFWQWRYARSGGRVLFYTKYEER